MLLSKNSLIKFPFEVSSVFFVPAHHKLGAEVHRGGVCAGNRKAHALLVRKAKQNQIIQILQK